MACLSREHMLDEIQTRYNLTPEEYLEEDRQADPQVAADATPDGQETAKDRDVQRDHGVERQSVAVLTGNLQNEVDTQNATATAEELWDSGDRRVNLAEFLTERVAATDIGREGVAAVLAADLSNGTPPSVAVEAGRRSDRRQGSPQPERVGERSFRLE